MTPADIERAARNNAELPEKLTQPEQLLFLSLRAIYRDYKTKAIDRETGAKEKRKALAAYDQAAAMHRLFTQTAEMRNRLSTYLCEIEKGGCEKCQQAVKIFDGR